MKRMSFHSGVALIAISILVQRCLADEVIVESQSDRPRTIVGTIKDYLGDTLLLQVTARNERKIAAETILEIRSDWQPDHNNGDDLFQLNKFAEALSAYSLAFKAEERRWARRLILSRVVQCQHNLKRNSDACTNFARLTSDDPDCPFFDVIPLAWQKERPSGKLQVLSSRWLGAENEASQRLMACSWLMVIGERSVIRQTLLELARSSNPKIASLAMGQLWRSQLLTARENQLAGWRQQIDEMPVRLRGGPYFVLGDGLARFKRNEEAILAWMRVPSRYKSNRILSAASLLRAAELLKSMGRTGEAMRLYSRLRQEYPETEESRASRAESSQ